VDKMQWHGEGGRLSGSEAARASGGMPTGREGAAAADRACFGIRQGAGQQGQGDMISANSAAGCLGQMFRVRCLRCVYCLDVLAVSGNLLAVLEGPVAG
jgi:hypothetical protein